mmetsp:Transcript_7633/g.23072  ORF Transcript_7633/g.23072 Transcript_7633/m.23072 type:complete len:247 (-) Transcript_7633:498-1238(-)
MRACTLTSASHLGVGVAIRTVQAGIVQLICSNRALHARTRCHDVPGVATTITETGRTRQGHTLARTLSTKVILGISTRFTLRATIPIYSAVSDEASIARAIDDIADATSSTVPRPGRVTSANSAQGTDAAVLVAPFTTQLAPGTSNTAVSTITSTTCTRDRVHRTSRRAASGLGGVDNTHFARNTEPIKVEMLSKADARRSIPKSRRIGAIRGNRCGDRRRLRRSRECFRSRRRRDARLGGANQPN